MIAFLLAWFAISLPVSLLIGAWFARLPQAGY
jgi:hypothetical protein